MSNILPKRLNFRAILGSKSCYFCSVMPLHNVNKPSLKAGDAEPPPIDPKSIRLYIARYCPFSQRALIYAAKKNLNADIINIDLDQKPEWLVSKNDKGQVPVLEQPDGKVVTDSVKIPEYLDEKFPENRILPSDPKRREEEKQLFEKLSGFMQPAFFGLVKFGKDSTGKHESYSDILKAFDEAEALLKDNFYSGAEVGFTDYLIFPIIQRIQWMTYFMPEFPFDTESFPSFNKYPRLSSWFENVGNLPEVTEGSQPKELGVGFFKDHLRGKSNYDYGL